MSLNSPKVAQNSLLLAQEAFTAKLVNNIVATNSISEISIPRRKTIEHSTIASPDYCSNTASQIFEVSLAIRSRPLIPSVANVIPSDDSNGIFNFIQLCR